LEEVGFRVEKRNPVGKEAGSEDRGERRTGGKKPKVGGNWRPKATMIL